jgi:hypothetical protein
VAASGGWRISAMYPPPFPPPLLPIATAEAKATLGRLLRPSTVPRHLARRAHARVVRGISRLAPPRPCKDATGSLASLGRHTRWPPTPRTFPHYLPYSAYFPATCAPVQCHAPQLHSDCSATAHQACTTTQDYALSEYQHQPIRCQLSLRRLAFH